MMERVDSGVRALLHVHSQRLDTLEQQLHRHHHRHHYHHHHHQQRQQQQQQWDQENLEEYKNHDNDGGGGDEQQRKENVDLSAENVHRELDTVMAEIATLENVCICADWRYCAVDSVYLFSYFGSQRSNIHLVIIHSISQFVFSSASPRSTSGSGTGQSS